MKHFLLQECKILLEPVTYTHTTYIVIDKKKLMSAIPSEEPSFSNQIQHVQILQQTHQHNLLLKQ